MTIHNDKKLVFYQIYLQIHKMPDITDKTDIINGNNDNNNYKQRKKTFSIINIWHIFCHLLIPGDTDEDGGALIYRSKLVLIFIISLFVILTIKLVLILKNDVYKHRYYQYNSKQPFSRVSIVDRNGKILSHNISVFTLYLQASKIDNFSKEIDKINKVIPNAITDKNKIIKKLEKRKTSNRTIFIKKNLSIQQKQALIDSGVQGLVFEDDEKRFYTSRPANNIVGYCPSNNNCISGIEKGENEYLTVPNNQPLRLSIDNVAQTILRDILNEKVINTQSKGASGIIMKIDTGEIIAGVSIPDCDYNNYELCSPESLFNNYSLGVYELGSVFKLFLAATALQYGISPYKAYKREEYRLGNFVIHDIDRKEQQGGQLNLIDTIRISSNVGCAKIVEDIDLFYQFKYLANLGILTKLDTELPESGRPIYPKKWTLINGITASYGHGIATTPLNFASAIASLLNNKPVKPTFIATDAPIETENYTYLDEDKIDVFKDIMRQVVNAGGGNKAYIDEYDIGGKTGTAMQIKNGKYDKYSNILSFVAVLPMYKPEYVFFITLNYPKVDDANIYKTRGYELGSVMNQIISTIGPILNIKPI